MTYPCIGRDALGSGGKMRGKFTMSSIVVLMIACHMAFAVQAQHSLNLNEASTGYQQRYTLPMPSTAIRAELTELLMEMAISDIDASFSNQWLELIDSSDQAKDPETYFNIYSLLSQFRTYWYALDWNSRERFHLKQFRPVSSPELREQYVSILKNPNALSFINQLRPNSENYLSSRRALLSLLQLSREGQWPSIPDTKIYPGEQNNAVPMIREVLVRNNDLLPNNQAVIDKTVYDESMVDAIKVFQRRHGLAADGVVGRRTLNWLRLAPQVRAVILARSILRSDFPREKLGSRYVLVNIPEFQMRVWDGNNQIFSSRVIVGQVKRQTPILSSEISSVVLNPAWHVPKSILQKDLVPKMLKDKDFFDKGQFELVDSQGETVSPDAIAWDEAESNFPYQLRQKPGDHNALGRYKFYLPNNDAIYLHSTSMPSYFEKDLRALSSGCVRVEDADNFARLLLKGSKWSVTKLDDLLKKDTTKWLPISNPVPVYTVYWRGWVDGSGQLQLRDDIYRFDDDAKMANTPVIDSLIRTPVKKQS